MSKAAKFDDIDLMQYADGEVDEATAQEIASYLDSAPAAKSKVDALGDMSETMRSYLELAADDAEPRLDALWANIERRVQGNGVRGAVRAEAAEPARKEAARAGLFAAIGHFFESYRSHFLTGAVAAGAAAALIMALRPAREVVVEKPIVIRETATPAKQAGTSDSTPAELKLAKDESSPPEIEHMEVTDGSGVVFMMPKEGEDDVSATVIFVDMNDVEGPL